jgi:hypothetical protein
MSYLTFQLGVIQRPWDRSWVSTPWGVLMRPRMEHRLTLAAGKKGQFWLAQELHVWSWIPTRIVLSEEGWKKEENVNWEHGG